MGQNYVVSKQIFEVGNTLVFSVLVELFHEAFWHDLREPVLLGDVDASSQDNRRTDGAPQPANLAGTPKNWLF